jgi:hypothetical protein
VLSRHPDHLLSVSMMVGRATAPRGAALPPYDDGECFIAPSPAKHISDPTKPFPAAKQPAGNVAWLSNCPTNGASAPTLSGDHPMRTISFILAFTLVLAGPTMSGPTDSTVPGAGTFTYDAAPALATVVAGLTLARPS